MAQAELVDYYRRRAPEYEAIYAKPERQADLRQLEIAMAQALRGRRVLEIACGTGYWTERVAPEAAGIVATDVAAEPMEIARVKRYPPGRVRFEPADAYALPEALGRFDGALAVFWWSHIPRARIPAFLASLHARLERGARVVLMDNRYVEGSSTPISERDAGGDTFQLRRLADGSQMRVLKNFPTEADLRAALGSAARELDIRWLEYYWLVQYELP